MWKLAYNVYESQATRAQLTWTRLTFQVNLERLSTWLMKVVTFSKSWQLELSSQWPRSNFVMLGVNDDLMNNQLEQNFDLIKFGTKFGQPTTRLD